MTSLTLFQNRRVTMVTRYTFQHGPNLLSQLVNLNCTDNYDVAKIKVKSVTDHQ